MLLKVVAVAVVVGTGKRRDLMRVITDMKNKMTRLKPLTDRVLAGLRTSMPS